MKTVNFTECGLRYTSSPALIAKYNYSGRVQLIPANPLTQITDTGCKELCGHGNEYYPWADISATITTWVLPILGVILQAPFESNAFWRTVKALNRWIGSPISTLASILWDIKISGKCALFVDMSVPYDESPDEDSEFANMRDSFYLLMNLNQYKMKPVISLTREAEGLLRIVLFSKDLKLLGRKKTLSQMRYRLAHNLRSSRRRGVVPVFLSTLWFILALGISVEAAFDDIGSNLQAHNLAMGLFISWLPLVILCSILDRNPVSSDDIQRKLNKLIDSVCDSLLDEETRNDFIASFRDTAQAQHVAKWVEKITAKAPYIKGDYFCGFAGQSRTRFHYGAAHAILVDIEKAYIAGHGRAWFMHPGEARAALLLGNADQGFTWFDGRQIWQIFSAIFLVGGTAAGAFVLSYNTPTVGLGCRTGGYTIFFVVAMVLLLAEILVWWATSPLRQQDRFHKHVEEYTRHMHLRKHVPHTSLPGLVKSRRMLSSLLSMIEYVVLQIAILPSRILPLKNKKRRRREMEAAIHGHFVVLQGLTLRNWLQRGFFTPLEFFNMIWAAYMIMAQTVGAFQNCACMTSSWTGLGGYLDFTEYVAANTPYVRVYWIEGTVITCVVMGVGMGYIVLEWLLQAHLSTENYKDAMQGLRRVRRFRRATNWIWHPINFLVIFIDNALSLCGLRSTNERKVLNWSKETTYQPSVSHAIIRLATDAQTLPFHEVEKSPTL